MSKGNKNPEQQKKMYLTALGVLMLLSVLGLFLSARDSIDQVEEISYNEFKSLVKADSVETVVYSPSEEYMTIILWTEESREMTKKERETWTVPNEAKRKCLYPAHEDFRKELLESDVEVKLSNNSKIVDILSTLLSLCLPLIWVFFIFKMINKQTRGLDANSLMQTSNVKFDSVIGQDEILDDIKFITKLVKNPDLGKSVGARTPKGVLLVGPPGTGKTLIAKAVAGEAGVPFLSIGGSDFKEMFIGLGAKRVRDLFETARKNAPCVVFIDEIDSVGAKRETRGATSEDNQTINALLKEMDGFTGREGIFVIAATNRVDTLDSALVRAGRFDRQIHVNPPRDWQVRADLFKYYFRDVKLSDDVDIEVISKQVVGFTGADIASICNEASIIAVMNDKQVVDRACLEEAIDKKVFNGNRSKKEQYKNDKMIVAYHEAGHAIMTILCGLDVSRASIQSTTSGVGGVVFGAETDSKFMTNDEMEKRVLVAYAGRVSEQIKFGYVTIGASNDIQQATKMLASYVDDYGFCEDVGLINMKILRENSIVFSDISLVSIQNLSKELYERCLDILTKNYEKVELLATKLLEVETLSGKEIKELLGC